MKLIVGLGNPGKEYAHTRHNVGFRVLDQLINPDDWTINKKLKAVIKKLSLGVRSKELGDRGDGVLYLKPFTYMNSSGEAVKAVMDYYHVTVPELLVVFDDKDLPLGTIRYRRKGSSGGHNGVQSVIDQLGSSDFARLKVGIAPATPDGAIHDTTDYVLGTFSKEEEQQLPEIIKNVVLKVNDWVQR